MKVDCFRKVKMIIAEYCITGESSTDAAIYM